MNKPLNVFIAASSLLLCLPAPASADGETVNRLQQVTTADMLNPVPMPPVDIYRPSGSVGPRHQDLATFAWLEFIALVAPMGDVRGEPGGSFATSGLDQIATLVWESYQHRSELFPYTDGSTNPPQPWNAPPLYQFYVSSSNDKVAYQTPADVTRYNNLDEATQIGQNALFFPELIDDGDDDDQFLDQVLFEAKVNKVQSDYVRNRVEQGLTDPIDLDNNTIEVKAAWLPLTAIPEYQHYRYHISEVTVYGGDDDDPVAKTELRALIGLHIIQKTENFPAFIFATFEHTDLLQDPDSHAPTDVAYVPSYDEIAYQTPSQTTLNGITGQPVVDNPLIHFWNRYPIARPNGNTIKLPLGHVESLPGAMIIDNDEVLVPVVQPDTTNKDVAKVNSTALKAMSMIPGFDENFVWQYYKLKGVQGVPSNREQNKDFYLANIVIESSQPGIQLFRGGTSTTTVRNIVTFNNIRNQTNVIDDAQGGAAFSHGGCQGCHGVAQTQAGSDFSFLFGGKEGNGFTPDTTGMKTREVMLIRQERYSLMFPKDP